jgi:hypothetical protein
MGVRSASLQDLIECHAFGVIFHEPFFRGGGKLPTYRFINPEECDDGGLVCGDRIEIAHLTRSVASFKIYGVLPVEHSN